MHLPSRLYALLAAGLLASCSQTPAGPSSADTVQVKVIAINDLHGNLQPPSGGYQPAGAASAVAAGGTEYLHSAVATLKAKNPHHVFVAAGDLIGASPLLSALFHDEPTIESLNLMGLELAAVGNHEFDQGLAELLRRQNGGCHPKQGCTGGHEFKGARFQYLAASTVDDKTGRTVLPAYQVKRFDQVPVAFIGLTLQDTHRLVSADGIAGLTFGNEVETVNRLVPQLRAQGIEAIVVLIHEGGTPAKGIDGCDGISGPIVQIVQQLDKAVDLIVSGHTHHAYTCQIDGRLVTSGHRYGTMLTEIDLELDKQSRDVKSARAGNLLVRHSEFRAEPAQTALIQHYEALSAPLRQRPVGSIAAPFSREPVASGATAMGQLLSDAYLAATRAPEKGGAQIALTNIGSIRAGLERKGPISYGDIYAVQPFGNNLVTLSLSGALLQQVLEQQFRPAGQDQEILQVSAGFTYQWDDRAPLGQKIVPGSLRLNGQPILASQQYRVTVNSFLASGSDGFTLLREATDALTGSVDLDQLEAYLQANPGLSPAPFDRIVRTD